MAENRVKDFINTVDLVKEQMIQKKEISTIDVAVKLEGLDQVNEELDKVLNKLEKANSLADELAPFANNPHQTEYTKMMHRYADLDKREKAVRRKQRFANWMLFASVVLVIGCMIATAFVCTTIQSIRL